jgi:hypothetical protein
MSRGGKDAREFLEEGSEASGKFQDDLLADEKAGGDATTSIPLVNEATSTYPAVPLQNVRNSN